MSKETLAVLAFCLGANAAAWNGTYKTASGFVLEVSGASAAATVLKLSGSYRDNVCLIETTPLRLNRGLGTYRPKDDPDCVVQVRLRGNQASVNQKGVCGCGLNVNLSGIYKK